MGLESFCTLCKFSIVVDGIWLMSVIVSGWMITQCKQHKQKCIKHPPDTILYLYINNLVI